MFGIGETELIIIVVFAIMVFGPDKLPGMGRTIGRALRQFREAQEGFSQVVQAEVVDPLNEAMNEPSARKKAREAAAAQAEDADLDDDLSTATVKRAETFAERKARLKAERETREAAEATATDQPAGAGDGPVDGKAAPAEAEAADSDADAAEQKAAVPEESPTIDTSAAALYAMAPRGRSAYRADEPAEDVTAEGAAPTQTGGVTDESSAAEDGPVVGQTLPADSASSSATVVGGEDGSAKD